MYNKKVLSEATRNLNSTKAPATKKDKVVATKPIVSKEGYKQGPPPPGTHYRIPGDRTGTSIYNPTPYPLNLVGPNGTQAQIGPWDTRTQHFNEPYMDEHLRAKKGGSLPSIPKKKGTKAYSRDITATNQLFAQNPILKKKKKKNKKIFDPNAKYFEKGGFQDDIDKRRPVLRDWTYGQSIGMLQEKAYGGDISIPELNQAQEGQEVTSDEKVYASKELETVPVKGEQLPVYKYEKEFEKKNSWEDFLYDRKVKYLRRTSPGLNKAAGVTMENFPKDAEDRIRNAYEEKKGDYVVSKLFKDRGWNPNKRESKWVDFYNKEVRDLSESGQNVTADKLKELDLLYKSKYSSKLHPSTWTKFLSGVQQATNVLLPNNPILGNWELEFDIPGYTKEENKEAKTSLTEPLKALTGATDFLGAAIGNALATQAPIAGTEGQYRPGLSSGELLGKLPEGTAELLNPAGYGQMALSGPSIAGASRELLALKPFTGIMNKVPGAIGALSEAPYIGRAAKTVLPSAEKVSRFTSRFGPRFNPSIGQLVNAEFIGEGIGELPKTFETAVDYAYEVPYTDEEGYTYTDEEGKVIPKVSGLDLATQVGFNALDFAGINSLIKSAKPYSKSVVRALDKPRPYLNLSNPQRWPALYRAATAEGGLRQNWQQYKAATESMRSPTLGDALRASTALKFAAGIPAAAVTYKTAFPEYFATDSASEKAELAKTIGSQVASDVTGLAGALTTTSNLMKPLFKEGSRANRVISGINTKAADVYNSKLATAYYTVDNANKLRKQDAEGARVINNLARMLQMMGRKEGGEHKLGKNEINFLKKLGYKVEYLD